MTNDKGHTPANTGRPTDEEVEIPEQLLSEIVFMLEYKFYHKGEKILELDEPIDSVLFICEGVVDVNFLIGFNMSILLDRLSIRSTFGFHSVL